MGANNALWLVCDLVLVLNTLGNTEPIAGPAQRTITEWPSIREIETDGTFGGCIPVSYDVQLQLPVIRRGFKYGSIVGTSTMHVQAVRPTKHLYVNVRNMDLSACTISVRSVQSNRPIVVQSHREHKNQQLLQVTVESALNQSSMYLLTVHNYVARVNGPFKMGIYSGLAYAQPTALAHTYVSQFQSSWARSVFPCIDHPRFKSTFKLALVYPPQYLALSSAQKESEPVAEGTGWRKQQFVATPLLSAYTWGMVLLPATGYSVIESDQLQPPLHMYYNKYRISTRLAKRWHEYAMYSWQQLSQMFKRVTLPLSKLDYVIVPQFKVQGMENWALITLNQQYLLRNSQAFRMSLIAHETAHQWISNLVTVKDWRFLCLQEALTDHYARRIVRLYFGTDNKQWDNYILDKYLVSTRQESGTVPPEDLYVDSEPSMLQVGQRCFGKAVFIVDSLAAVVGNNLKFDQHIQNFLQSHRHSHFNLTDFTQYFDDIKIGQSPSLSAGSYFKEWFETAGYPTVTLHRQYGHQNNITLYQQALFPKAQSYAVQSHVWPIVVSMHSAPGTAPVTVLLRTQAASVQGSPLHDNQWIMANSHFTHFYRVNYDNHNWLLLARALTNQPLAFSSIDRVRTVHDFCFFNSIGVLQNSEPIFTQFMSALRANPQYFPMSSLYSTTCAPQNTHTRQH